MTAEEAMERAHLILIETPMGPGVWDRQERAIAAALIEAEIELIAECRRRCTEMAGFDGRKVYYDWMREQHRSFDAALAELEAPQ